jgi:hypothetical protein
MIVLNIWIAFMAQFAIIDIKLITQKPTREHRFHYYSRTLI